MQEEDGHSRTPDESIWRGLFLDRLLSALVHWRLRSSSRFHRYKSRLPMTTFTTRCQSVFWDLLDHKKRWFHHRARRSKGRWRVVVVSSMSSRSRVVRGGPRRRRLFERVDSIQVFQKRGTFGVKYLRTHNTLNTLISHKTLNISFDAFWTPAHGLTFATCVPQRDANNASAHFTTTINIENAWCCVSSFFELALSKKAYYSRRKRD